MGRIDEVRKVILNDRADQGHKVRSWRSVNIEETKKVRRHMR
jgi:hypothetical protein